MGIFRGDSGCDLGAPGRGWGGRRGTDKRSPFTNTRACVDALRILLGLPTADTMATNQKKHVKLRCPALLVQPKKVVRAHKALAPKHWSCTLTDSHATWWQRGQPCQAATASMDQELWNIPTKQRERKQFSVGGQC